MAQGHSKWFLFPAYRTSRRFLIWSFLHLNKAYQWETLPFQEADVSFFRRRLAELLGALVGIPSKRRPGPADAGPKKGGGRSLVAPEHLGQGVVCIGKRVQRHVF